ncbi:hypothetical protein C8J56DRAFT_1058203 [Mycena floridula]|nr:hypothetical protein C8J56DRAFT_1058203 [Mycena floridula]
MPFKLARFLRHNKIPETSCIAAPIAERLNANDGGARMAAVIQSLHHTRLDNINAPVLSNNQLTTVYNHHQPPDNKDYAQIKVRDIILKTELKSGTHHELQPDGTLLQPAMLIRKYEGLAAKDWERDLEVFSAVRHPNILQLYGVCDSRHFTALIFHSGHQSTFRDYHLSLSGPSFVTWISGLLEQYYSAADDLRTHHLRPLIPLYNVDHAGQLMVHTFSSCSSDGVIFNPKCFFKSLLEEYYDVLAMTCEMYSSLGLTNFNVSMRHQEGTTTLHVPRPYIYGLNNWYPEEASVLCECMPDMSIRCTIPTSDLHNIQFYQWFAIGVQSAACEPSHAPVIHTFNLWASQVHHLSKQMEINYMEIQTNIPWYIIISCTATPKITVWTATGAEERLQQCTLLYLWFDRTSSSDTWWSTDLKGQAVIPTTKIEDAFNISLDIKIYMPEYHIPQQIYSILWDIHKACGFNPESTEIAEYLGYPLLEPVLEPNVAVPRELLLLLDFSSQADDFELFSPKASGMTSQIRLPRKRLSVASCRRPSISQHRPAPASSPARLAGYRGSEYPLEDMLSVSNSRNVRTSALLSQAALSASPLAIPRYSSVLNSSPVALFPNPCPRSSTWRINVLVRRPYELAPPLRLPIEPRNVGTRHSSTCSRNRTILKSSLTWESKALIWHSAGRICDIEAGSCPTTTDSPALVANEFGISFVALALDKVRRWMHCPGYGAAEDVGVEGTATPLERESKVGDMVHWVKVCEGDGGEGEAGKEVWLCIIFGSSPWALSFGFVVVSSALVLLCRLDAGSLPSSLLHSFSVSCFSVSLIIFLCGSIVTQALLTIQTLSQSLDFALVDLIIELFEGFEGLGMEQDVMSLRVALFE